ncbi:HNH endonuclease signature motif containing protein [Kutzneria sp. CA-103260]|uniref:HNH endonuclease signature motif containing protein n=1 Tax=Kutzneria sp. CA-103260 TaxID=2802641 RepID=UPI001BA55E11|nr:HNH endonuclease signature motif containing protein [Kutzneria sp. CA-103260]
MKANPGIGWWRLDGESLWSAGARMEACRRADYVRQVEVVKELWERTARSKDDQATMVADLAAQWGITRAEARDLLRHGELFGREAIREAAGDGLLSKQHLVVIDKTLAEAPEERRDEVEAALLENAQEFDGATLRVIGRHILQLLDQDGKAPDDQELAEPTRELHLTSRKDGSVVFRGKVDQESGAKLTALLSPLAKPTSAGDTRTTAERQGDAFAEIIDLAANSEDLPAEGGERPHLALTMSLKDFQEQRGTADVEGMGPMDAASARRVGCDSKVMRVVLGAKSEVLDIGRTARTIPNQIRQALIIRDKGCAFPGCQRRPRQCHAHHVIHWADGGPTSVDNLVLLCGSHHRLVHHSHWQVTISDGKAEFTAGPDRDQRWGRAG